MKTSTLLKRAWALIEDPKHWTTRTFARTARGRECSATDPLARKFCAIGALQRAAFACDAPTSPARGVLRTASNYTTVQTNDDGGHEAVRKMYAKAIKAAARREARQRGPGAARNRSPKGRKTKR